MFRKLLRTTLFTGGAASGALVAFPVLEDMYWHKKTPGRFDASSAQLKEDNKGGRPKLLILGSGWGSAYMLKNIDKDKYDITVVSPRNYFLYTPLLPSVAVGTLSPTSISVPVRNLASYKASSYYDRIRFILRGYLPPMIKYYHLSAYDCDIERKVISCKDEGLENSKLHDIPYDLLVIAVGSNTNTFGTKGVEKYCHFLKQINDAKDVRQNILKNLENASLPGVSEKDKKRLCSFYIVGGGPTGVETAGELQDFMEDDVINSTYQSFNNIRDYISISIVQSNKALLPSYPIDISDFAENRMKEVGINVLKNSRVTEVTESSIKILDKITKTTREVPYGLCLWSTGVSPNPFCKKIMKKIPCQSNYRSLKTHSNCRVLGARDIFAIGDCGDIDLLNENKRHVQRFWKAAAKSFNCENILSEEANISFITELNNFWANNLLIGYKEKQLILEEYQKGLKTALKKKTFRGVSENEVLTVVDEIMGKRKSYPPLASVAHQQGIYLANILNNAEIVEDGRVAYDNAPPFEYENHGKLVYVGSHLASASFGKESQLEVSWNGLLTNLFWHAAYFGMLEDFACRFELLLDWIKTEIFGRSTAADINVDERGYKNSLSHTSEAKCEGYERDEKRRWITCHL